ncbi:hypothetical protein ACFQV2_29265 [Actinokineospora soli]|uniref:Uncharacterized protein n=1 Tax=Actinokineospora soli TaxID=1048753 RepID=A0ABW2TSW8_9PSEU
MNGASGLRRPADAQFWFGDPLPEDSLPPIEEHRNGHALLPPTPGDTRYPPAAPAARPPAPPATASAAARPTRARRRSSSPRSTRTTRRCGPRSRTPRR